MYKWPRGTKKKLLDRDGKGCVICWSQQDLVIHHYWEDRGIDQKEHPYWEKIEDNWRPRFDLQYLVLLCRSCHGKVHTVWADSPYMKLFHSIMEKKRNTQNIETFEEDIGDSKPVSEDTG